MFYIITTNNKINKLHERALRLVHDDYVSTFEAAELGYTNKTKEPITSQKRGSRDFCRIANSVFNNGKSAISPLFNIPEVLSSASNKTKLFIENFSKNSHLDESSIFLPVFPSRTNLQLHIFSVTPKMVKKVITSLDLAKASGTNGIALVYLRTVSLNFHKY